MIRSLRSALALTGLALLALAPSALAASTLLETYVAGSGAKLRTCHSGVLPAGSAVKSFKVTAADTGLVRVASSGSADSDWDLAVFGTDGRFVAAAAGPTSDDVAAGFAVAGEPLTVQACLVRGNASSLQVSALNFAAKLSGKRAIVQILAVNTPTREDRNKLEQLGLDDAHSFTDTTVDIVASSVEDYFKLQQAGLTWTTKVPDLLALERRRAKADAEFAPRAARTALPSGSTGYRHLADYDAEMKAMAAKSPGLVKLLAMPNKSLEGRTILGVEIGKNVNVDDGKPVLAMFGVHHAREWPSGELTLEWAYELANGYGKNERITKLVDQTRAIVVPIVNPDGFNLSREAPIDPGNALAMVDLPPDVDNQLPITDPTYTAALIVEGQTGTFAYKRRNCRIKDGALPAPGECENSDNRALGTDPNRNYGGFWGGGGASVELTDDTYRGAAPFSEPEVANVRDVISTRQVTTMITNHTFSNLILRPPGIKQEGATPDEPIYKAFADKMATFNGYTSQFGYALYDTTGTTEDWSYYATGGFGFTYEIGPDEFHPPYEEVVAEYDGAGQYAGKGNREAYLYALEHTADTTKHSVIAGSAAKGATLRLHKQFESQTSPVLQDIKGNTGPPRPFTDILDTTIPVGDDGRFDWHINPSTRPYVMRDRSYSDVAKEPAQTLDASSATPVLPLQPKLVEFEVKPEAARQIRAVVEGSAPDDYDIYLYEGSGVDPAKQVSSSASADAVETIVYSYPNPGKYTLEIRNYSAVQPVSGSIQVFGEVAGSKTTVKAHKETWALTCEVAGRVVAKRDIDIARGEKQDLGNVCAEPRGSRGLRLTVAVRRAKNLKLSTVLRRGLLSSVRCSTDCSLTASLQLDRRTAKKLRLSTTLAKTGKAVNFNGKRNLRLRLTKQAKTRLRRQRTVSARLVVVARDALGVSRSRTVSVRLRR